MWSVQGQQLQVTGSKSCSRTGAGDGSWKHGLLLRTITVAVFVDDMRAAVLPPPKQRLGSLRKTARPSC